MRIPAKVISDLFALFLTEEKVKYKIEPNTGFTWTYEVDVPKGCTAAVAIKEYLIPALISIIERVTNLGYRHQLYGIEGNKQGWFTEHTGLLRVSQKEYKNKTVFNLGVSFSPEL